MFRASPVAGLDRGLRAPVRPDAELRIAEPVGHLPGGQRFPAGRKGGQCGASRAGARLGIPSTPAAASDWEDATSADAHGDTISDLGGARSPAPCTLHAAWTLRCLSDLLEPPIPGARWGGWLNEGGWSRGSARRRPAGASLAPPAWRRRRRRPSSTWRIARHSIRRRRSRSSSVHGEEERSIR